MFLSSTGIRLWLYRRPTDMRKSFDGLAALVRHGLDEDPLSGALFTFVNRRRTIMKVLYFEGDWTIHPERFVRGRPKHRPLPEVVWINPPNLPTGDLVQ